MEDWEEHEPPDRRGRKRASAKAQRPPDLVKAYRDRLLDSLYHHGVRYYRTDEPEYLIPCYVAMKLGIEAWSAAAALTILAEDGFVRGPIDLPKTEDDGSPVRYRTNQGPVEWDGKKWVTSIDKFGIGSWKRGPRGRFIRLSKKEIQRQIRQRERERRPVNFDGRGFELLDEGAPYKEYGDRMGFFKESDRTWGGRDPEPPRETCPRCLSVVEYRNRHGKRRRDHGLKKCNLLLVKRIMEE